MHPVHGFPRAEVFDDFRLEQSDDGFGQCVVVAVSDASDRHVDSGFVEPIALQKTRCSLHHLTPMAYCFKSAATTC